MKLRRALWAIPAIVPATVVPLSTMTSCSQVWGHLTPISIGTNIKGGALDPFAKWSDDDTLFDLNGEAVGPQLQSNFAIDMASSTYYGYSLPQKWDSTVEDEPESGFVWNKGKFVDGSAAWLTPSSSAFVQSARRTGKTDAGKAVAETKYSYRNNILSTNIELVSIIANAINQYLNYSIQYQGSQIGTTWHETETNTDLGYCWGNNLVHGDKSSTDNRNFFESIFASNAVSTTGKAQAALRPTHVEISFQDLPVATYSKTGTTITGVSSATKTLLNGADKRPSEVATTEAVYYNKKPEDKSETINNFRTGNTEKYVYRVYSYLNVPVRVRLNSFAKSYVNPTKSGGYRVSDFYSSQNTIKSAVGSSWKGILNKFADGAEVPTASSFQFVQNNAEASLQGITPKTLGEATQYDARLNGKLKQNDFIVLLNFSYKQYMSGEIGTAKTPATEAQLKALDRVTMTGFSNIFPAYMLDTKMDLSSFFVRANKIDGQTPGYIIDSSKVNTYNNKFLSLVKRTSKESMRTQHASQLSTESKKLLRFLGYMFGSGANLEVNTENMLTVTAFNE